MKHITIIVTLFLSVTLTGCGVKNPYGTVPVSGLVTLDSQPIEGVIVTFIPESGEMSAVGATDADGKFVLSTAGAPYGSGALPGGYSVSLSKTEIPGAGLRDEADVIAKYGTATPPPIYHIPQKYGDPKTSGIVSVNVEKGKKNHFEFEVKTK